MTFVDVLSEINLPNAFSTDGKRRVYEIPDSDEFSHIASSFDRSNKFEEDLDSQDINLFTNKIVYIDIDGEVECTLFANFEKDEYSLTIEDI